MNDKLCLPDANVLVYAYDLDSGQKRSVARALIEGLWRTGSGAVSLQGINETFVALIHKIARPLPIEQAHRLLKRYLLHWPVLTPVCDDFDDAVRITRRYQLSFWDSYLLACAARNGVEVVYTEDMQHGLIVEGVTIINPFADHRSRPKGG